MTLTIEQLEPQLWRITEPWYAEHANLYVVVGSAATLLIDTGCGVESLPAALADAELVPNVVVTTHCHFDHCGGLYQFSPEQVHLSARQATGVHTVESWALSYLTTKDVDAAHRSAVVGYSPQPPTAWQPLGSFIDLGDLQLTVIAAPGHTNDSVMFYEPTRGWLFTGDTLYTGELYTGFNTTHLEDWRQTLTTIESLSPRQIYPGHNQPLTRAALSPLLKNARAQLK